MTLDARLTLADGVALRPEPFGALAYDFDTRRLTFLKRPELLRVLQSLDGQRPLRDVLTACGIPRQEWVAFDAAMTRLIDSAMVRAEPGEGTHEPSVDTQ
jgi:putative mycofactocin binding protein MftB